MIVALFFFFLDVQSLKAQNFEDQVDDSEDYDEGNDHAYEVTVAEYSLSDLEGQGIQAALTYNGTSEP